MEKHTFQKAEFFLYEGQSQKKQQRLVASKLQKNYIFKIIKTKLNKTPEREYET